MTKAKTKPVLEPFIRSRAACPSCGYPFGSVNETKGIVHCHRCHETQPWPPPVPAIERLTIGLRDVAAYGMAATPVSKTSFRLELEGDEYLVTVAKA